MMTKDVADPPVLRLLHGTCWMDGRSKCREYLAGDKRLVALIKVATVQAPESTKQK